MREHAPVHWDGVNELWGIARYDDIVEIERRKDVFINSDQDKGGYRPNIPADRAIIGLDDPHHSLRRNLVARRFTPRAVADREHEVRAKVAAPARRRRSRPAAADRGHRRSRLAAAGADDRPAARLRRRATGPSCATGSERTIALGGGPRYMDEDGIVAAFEFAGAAAELYEQKRGCPMDDLMTLYTTAEVDGHAFGVDEAIADSLLLLDGGAETTRTVDRPHAAQPRRPPRPVGAAARTAPTSTVATEEFIRYVTPIHNMCRVPTTDYELGGGDDPGRQPGRADVLARPTATRPTSPIRSAST